MRTPNGRTGTLRGRAPAALLLAALLTAALLTAALAAPALAQNVFDPFATPAPTPAMEPAGRPYELQSGNIGNCKEWVNLREGPGKDYAIVGRIEKGAPIDLNGWSKDGAWCEIFYDNETRLAWVSGEFVVR